MSSGERQDADKMVLRSLPFLFSVICMILFGTLWFSVFSGPDQANGLSLVPLAYLLAFFGCVAFATSAQRYFLRTPYRFPLIALGILIAIGSHLAITLIFVCTIFLAASIRSGIMQWGVAYYFSLWLLYFGPPISITLGAVYGICLQKLVVRPN